MDSPHFIPIIDELSREFSLVCTPDGELTWIDARAKQLFGEVRGVRLTHLTAQGSEGKAEQLLAKAAQGTVRDWEMVCMARGEPFAAAFSGAPCPEGIAFVGTRAPEGLLEHQTQMATISNELARLHREAEQRASELRIAEQALAQSLEAAEQAREAERRLRVQEEEELHRLEQILDVMPEAVLVVDVAGVIVAANAAARALAGQDLVGQQVPDTGQPALDMYDLAGKPVASENLPLQRSLAGEFVRAQQFVIRNSAGNETAVSTNSVPLVDAAGRVTGAVAVYQDISELRALDRHKDEFLASVSHDLKNPLASIKGWSQMLLRRLQSIPEEQREVWATSLDMVQLTSNRMARMLDEILDITRLQMGQPLHPELQAMDLVAIVRRMIREFTESAPRHRLTVVTSEPELTGMWDQPRIERILDNLLSNAIKYSPKGGEVTVRIRTDSGRGGTRWARVEVHDEGLGIPPDDLPQLFNRFFRAGNVQGTPGLGLGLAGARALAELHGGTLDGANRVEGGAVFTLSLPLGRA